MSPYLAELFGTAILIIFGGGVVANVVLNKSKGHGSGWIVVATGWGLGVAIAVYAAGPVSGAHINPAVTLALAIMGKFPWNQVPGYVIAQFLGGFLGGVIVWLTYLAHWKETDDPAAKLAVFSTAPAIRAPLANTITEIIGSFVLICGIFWLSNPLNGVGNGMLPYLNGVLVWAIGLSLGGPTGYAINPARDLGPRLAHFVLPIHGKGDSDWSYAWVPVVGPLVGGSLGALFMMMLWNIR